MSNQTQRSGGIGVFGLLGVVFVTLKLVGVIDWSWWWVTAPFWGGFALALAFFAVSLTIALVVAVARHVRRRKTAEQVRHAILTRRSK